MGLIARIFGAKHTPQAQPGANIGMYAGLTLPQDPRSALVSNLLPAMTGPPGIRLSLSTNRADNYFGTDGLPPLRFPLSGPPHANRPFELEQAAFKPN